MWLMETTAITTYEQATDAQVLENYEAACAAEVAYHDKGATSTSPTRTVACESCGTSTFSPDDAPRICRVCADELAAECAAGLEPPAGVPTVQLGLGFSTDRANRDGDAQTSLGV